MKTTISGQDGQTVFHLSRTVPIDNSGGILRASLHKKSLRSQPKQSVEVLQELQFPVATTKIRCSANQHYIAAVGTYPPELKMYDVDQMAVKFIRRFDAEIVDFLFLSEDYKKLVFLQSDRWLNFHSQSGPYHQVRIPKFGRTLSYLPKTAELLIVGSSPYIYRLDLEEGIFEAPLKATHLNCIDQCVAHPSYPVVFISGPEGHIEAFDTRTWSPAASLQIPQSTPDSAIDITSMALSPEGMILGVGTSTGECLLYDLRSQRPYYVRDQKNQFPIKDIQLFKVVQSPEAQSRFVAGSLDCKVLKFWEPHQSATIASLHPEQMPQSNLHGQLNQFCVFSGSGLVMVAQDHPKIGTFYVPQLGLAPKWCSMLDTVLNESPSETTLNPPAPVAETQFVTVAQLEALHAEHLIGTSVLKPCMHGFEMPTKVYQKYKGVLDTQRYLEYQKEKLERKLEQRKSMRVVLKHADAQPDVNQELASDLKAKLKSKNAQVSQAAKSILTDDRFKHFFVNPDFAVETLEPPTQKRRHL